MVSVVMTMNAKSTLRNGFGLRCLLALLCIISIKVVCASTVGPKPLSLDDIERWPAYASDAAISDDGRWFVYKKRPFRSVPKEDLYIKDLKDHRTVQISNVARYRLSASKLIASQADSTLHIRDLSEPGREGSVVPGVMEWVVDPSRRWLAWTTRTTDHRAEVWLLDVQGSSAAQRLLSRKEHLMNLQWDQDGKSLSFYAGGPDKANTSSAGAHRLYLIHNAASLDRRVQVIDARAVLPSGCEWDSRGLLRWIPNGSGIVLGTVRARSAQPHRSHEPWVVVWHAQDASNPWKRSYAAAAGWIKPQKVLLNFDSNSVHFLTTSEWQTLHVAGRAKRWGLVLDKAPYARYGELTGDEQGDLYAVDLRNGKRKLLLRRLRDQNFMREFWASPDGERVLFWRNRQFNVYEIQSDVIRNLTAELPTSFVDRFNDRGKIDPPYPARGYRADGYDLSLGWSSDSTRLLLHDGKDLWKISVVTARAKNLTEAVGQELHWYQRLEILSEEAEQDVDKGIDFSNPIYVMPVDPRTERRGLARIDIVNETVELLRTDEALFADWYAPVLLKARNADVFVHHYERADVAPGYFVSGPDFREGRRLTGEDADTFRKEFAWSAGSKVLHYQDSDGQPLNATLYLPAGYVKGRRYPTIVEIYERSARGRFAFATPSYFLASRSFYNSNGYAVLRPDLTYEMNDPMISAAKYVQLALRKAIASGVVDPKRVGLTGQSFGGYETNFIITQTNAFKAAIASAGGANMLRYNLLRGYGTPVSAGSDHDQMRMRGPVDSSTVATFLRNSAIVHADQVRTPLLLINNDGDASVRWEDGLEYFNALRRQNKDVILLQYVGEGHSPPFKNKANEKDLAMRIKQFWDHHLKGADAPEWMRTPLDNQRLPEYFPQ